MNSYDYQCRICGAHPSSWSGNVPAPAPCKGNGANHVWMRTEVGSSRTQDWQCLNCGKRPSAFFVNVCPQDSRCSATGFNCVWVRT